MYHIDRGVVGKLKMSLDFFGPISVDWGMLYGTNLISLNSIFDYVYACAS
jgi:hypothetical protein